MTLTRTTTGTTDVDDQWRVLASCRSTDPDLFFPVGNTGTALDHIAQAKAVCASCPVRRPCLGYALATNQDAGVWGGASEDDRRALRQRPDRRAG